MWASFFVYIPSICFIHNTLFLCGKKKINILNWIEFILNRFALNQYILQNTMHYVYIILYFLIYKS